MLKPDPRTAELLHELAAAAERGDVQDVFVVFRGAEPYDYGLCYRSSNLEDMVFQVRTELINLMADRVGKDSTQ